MVSVKGGRIPSGSRREPGDGVVAAREREREEESERGWNIANHRISILMLRGGAVVSVEGATRWRL